MLFRSLCLPGCSHDRWDPTLPLKGSRDHLHCSHTAAGEVSIELAQETCPEAVAATKSQKEKLWLKIKLKRKKERKR